LPTARDTACQINLSAGSTVGSYLFSFFPAYILPHPFPGGFRQQN
jgi:hypothetical protein